MRRIVSLVNNTIERHSRAVRVSLVLMLAAAILARLIWLGYWQGWTGFNAYVDPKGEYHPAKTPWDWMELFIVPVVLAGGGLLFSRAERRAEREETERRTRAEREESERRATTEREIADERSRETALQNYLDKMTELLLDEGLRTSESDSEVRVIAQARTVTTLRQLAEQ
jgi:hypothetical protein